MREPPATRLTERLRLEPIGPCHARDLWAVHNDDEVAPWYQGWRPTLQEAKERAEFMDHCWRVLGVHKWMAYDRSSGELVGRGGLSRTPVDDDWRQLYAFLPPEPWVQESDESSSRLSVHAHWVEVGWALRREFWGRGYASEIGRAALDFAFDGLGMKAVVSCTIRHNRRSRAVMERIGMPFAGIWEAPEGRDDEAIHVLLRAEAMTQAKSGEL